MSEMKIAFDAKRAFYNGTGLGNYSRFIINNLVVEEDRPEDLEENVMEETVE